MSEKPITEDIARMCNVCRDLGYIGALADEYYHDSTGSDIADEITTYITELFNVKRAEPKGIIGDYVTVETYETEVNELKSIIEEKNKEIERLKNPYIEIKRKDFSHHPSENIYAKSLKNYDDEKEYDKEDWRMP